MPSFPNGTNGTIAHNIINDANNQVNYHGCTIYVVAITRSQGRDLPPLGGSLDLLQQIEQLLRDEAGPLDAHLQFQIDSVSQTLYLTSLAAKIAQSTPLADTLYRFIRPHAESCCSLLQQIFDMIDQYRVGLLPFKVWFLWQKVYVRATGDGRDIEVVRRELQRAQQSLDKILLALKFVSWTGLSTEALAKFPSFRTLLVHHHDRPSLRHVQLQKIIVVDHLGTSLPIPLEFCSSLQDINYVLLGYCQNRIGMHYIQDGDYQLIEPARNRVIDASDISRILKPETILEMSIIISQLQSLAGMKDSQKRCPRCRHLNAFASGEWIECTKCSGRFAISIADTAKTRDDMPGPKTARKRRHTENMASGHEMTVRRPESRAQLDETHFFRRIRVHLTTFKIYGCSTCQTRLADIHSLISRAFNGQHGRAYLFESVVNVTEGEPTDRMMTTGLHTLRDIFCRRCGTILGWKYDHADEPTQKYKEGKYVLERNLLVDVS